METGNKDRYSNVFFPMAVLTRRFGLLAVGLATTCALFVWHAAGRPVGLLSREREKPGGAGNASSTPEILSLSPIGSAAVRLTWQGASGGVYQLQRSDPGVGPWINSGAAVTSRAHSAMMVTNAVGGVDGRYYRVSTPPDPAADLPAFPGAEGFGAHAVGGRGGAVIFVTNLFDSGPGSLRAALEATGPRTIIFRVSGHIDLTRTLEITNAYVTIAGQTAPGDGVALRNSGLVGSPLLRVATHDVIIRHLRSRPGPDILPNGSPSLDALAIRTTNAHDIIIDHMSLSWAVDETMDIFEGPRDVTIQWSILSEGLYCSNHEKTVDPFRHHSFGDCPPTGTNVLGGDDHSRGMTISTFPGVDTDPDRISLHHNLWAHSNKRFPNITSDTLVDFVNNVVYNFEEHICLLGHKTTGGAVRVNFVRNYLKPGPNTPADFDKAGVHIPAGSFEDGGYQIYYEGNRAIAPVLTNLPQPLLDFGFVVSNRHDVPPVTESCATVAFTQVLAGAGATVPARDPVDQRLTNEVWTGTGSFIDDPADVGGWPPLRAGVPPPDADQDGMPDEWENAAPWLNPDDPADRNDDYDGDGYTELEEYLNSLAVSLE